MRWSGLASGGSGITLLVAALAGAAEGNRTLPPESLEVIRDGRTYTIPIAADRGYAAAPAPGLAEALGYAWLGGDLRLDGASVRFIEGSPFFTVGEAVFQLPNPVYRRGSELMIPASWALDWLPRNRPARWRYLDGRLIGTTRLVNGKPPGHRWLVVIDPGHGGADPGTRGVNGTREKDVTLAIARAVAERLSSGSDVDVLLTRDRDTLIALADRPRIARLLGDERTPDLFVSIHANSMPRRPHPMRGFETYFLGPARTDEARRVALRENASLQFEGDPRPEELDPLQFILGDLQVYGNQQESGLLAADVNRSLGRSLPGPDRGVKQAGYWVLVGASMPSVLVEVGFLSNPAEERMLRSASHQAKIADALAEAVLEYLSGYGRRVWSSHAGGG